MFIPQKYHAYTLRNFEEIPDLKARLSQDNIDAIKIVANVLPFKVNNYVVEHLIDWSNIPNDPIFQLTFPQKKMLSEEHYKRMKNALLNSGDKAIIRETANEIRHELNPHPAGQQQNVPEVDGIKLPGIQHKYRETVLFFPSNSQTCHAYCTFCFRWPQFVGIAELKFAMQQADLLVKYIKTKPEATDILFTGGDPMVMTTERFTQYINPILNSGIDHIKTIRIGTKSLTYWPYRFLTDKDSDDLLRLFERIVQSGYHLAIMAHFNHPREMQTEAVQTAIKRILATGAQIRTQSPVMKHINDNPEIWKELWKTQVNMGCIPYYMFVARDTGAQSYFAVPLERAWKIYKKAYQGVSGISRTVRGPSMSAFPGKVEVLGINELKGKKIFVLRFIQGRNPDWVDRPFFAEYNEAAIWFDELKPFNKDEFFFEKELNEMLNLVH